MMSCGEQNPGNPWRAILLALTVAAAGPAYGATSTAAPPAPIRESYKLPISPPRDQGDSDLCWVYATLSMLESNYMQKHPGSRIELSRAVLQRFSIEDRFQRQITGNSTHLEDGGVAVDALRLIRQNGVASESDFHGVVDSDPVFASLSRRLSRVVGASAKLKSLDAMIVQTLGPAPKETRLDGREMTPQQLATVLLGDESWTEYDVSKDGEARVGDSDDPDARPETRVHYVPLARVIDLIHESLKRGEAVVWGSTDNHALLIYGADYDADGRPLAYWIKDSFAPYSYRASAASIHRVLTDVTVAEPPVEEQTAAKN